ncbi:hypothetical protein PITCH_A220038 [uncultured Desulfobacterium sp.]|uniref:Uncharacterized protein n=1 Tax=uncultured Desulfobacterium sp. TaxID=201089 RepID=A0A445MY37_9BACT|nr:hypothetical protein PITCH_A220038 [uncultured Desulfobacterium sp.]
MNVKIDDAINHMTDAKNYLEFLRETSSQVLQNPTAFCTVIEQSTDFYIDLLDSTIEDLRETQAQA